jgi:outer membrane scaffolding protein for murein synthesis (MipA/OmpV family)
MTLLCSVSSAATEHDRKLQWEVGASIAALDIPLYPGSSESKQYLLPLPFLVLRSHFLDIDEGIRAKLFRSKDVHLNLSADFGVPVSSKDSDVRAGMPNLDTVLQVGPSLEISLSGARKKTHHLRLELPARLAFATDFGMVDNLGWIAEPRLTYETRRPFKTGFAWQLTAGLRYASADYHAYYYDVPAAFATPARPAFQSAGGYSGLFSDLIVNWRQQGQIYWALLRYQNVAGAQFAGSALVQQKQYYFLGFGMTWIFASSI